MLFQIYFCAFCLHICFCYCVFYVFQAVSSIVCGFILALAATVLLIQVKEWQIISTLWPRFGNSISKPYLIIYESKSIFVNFLFYSFQYTRTSLWSNMKPRFVFTNYQLLWNSCLSLNSCILNLLANEPLPFLVRWKWQTNLLTYLAQVFAGVLALITSILYFLAAAFAYKTIKDNM